MDISEIWAISKFLTLPAIAWIVFYLAKRVQRRRLRISIKTIASAFLFFFTALLLLLLLVSSACTKHVPPIYSPDSKHVAVLTYAMQGALGDDYASVKIRSRWSPFAEIIYDGLGVWDFKGNKANYPDVRWQDASHLRIGYYDDRKGKEGRGGPPICRSQLENIQIVCVNLAIGQP